MGWAENGGEIIVEDTPSQAWGSEFCFRKPIVLLAGTPYPDLGFFLLASTPPPLSKIKQRQSGNLLPKEGNPSEEGS